MYRRNITHVLGYIALALCAFIGYETWVKPKDLPSPPAQPPMATEDPIPPPGLETGGAPAVESHQMRVIDSVAPESRYAEVLQGIRAEIEKGNVVEAESKLAGLPDAVLSDSRARPYVAVLWNNLGVEQERQVGTKLSVEAFKKAVSYDPNNPTLNLNLAHAYWELRDPAMTPSFLETIISLAPDEPFPHLALADLLQEQDQLSEAARHIDRAAERAARDPALRSYLQTVSRRLTRADEVEARLTSHASVHFTVKFDGNEDQAAWIAVLDILEEAYREIGQKLGHFPSKPIVVVLHTAANFQTATGSPLWADGLFDPVLNRIQIPTQGALTDGAWLKRVLRHEFVHAVLADEQGSRAGSVPTWLNEGLAMQLSGDDWPELGRVEHGAGGTSLIPLPTLEGSWNGLSTAAAGLAYTEADSAVHYLIEHYGMHRVQELLRLLKAGQSVASAMEDKLSISYDQFQRRWADSFTGTAKAG